MTGLEKLNELDFAEELMDAFKVRDSFTEDYEQFEAPRVIGRTINTFLDAVTRIESQLDTDYVYSSDDGDWAHRARGALRRYKREVARLQTLAAARRRDENVARRAKNLVAHTEWSRKIHELLEEMAWRIEESGGSLEGLLLPANDGEATPMTVDEWLDVREKRRDEKAARAAEKSAA